MKRLLIETVVFIVGFCIMSLEIIASRVLAPYLGTSIIAWTSIIGMILTSLSAGYFLGGRYADKKATKERLGIVLVFASLYIFIFALFRTSILSFLTSIFKDLKTLSFIASGVFLFIPNFLLGAVSPYAVRLKLHTIKETGRTMGNLYAISTLGSILGTFFTGYFLISNFKISKILVGICVVLVISSFLLFKDTKKNVNKLFLLILIVVMVTFGLSWKPRGLGIYDVSSFYNRIIVQNKVINDKPALILNTSRVNLDDGYEGGMYLGSDDLAIEYTKYYRLAFYFNPKIEDALMIGGGPYSYPKDFLKRHPNSYLDVVEQDPKITQVAKDFFGLKENDHLNIYTQEGRRFMDRNNKNYDAVLLDIFNSDSSVPFQTSTREFLEKVSSSLNDNGVVVSNVASSLLGDKGKFFRAEYRTFKEVFPKVYVFLVSKPNDYYAVQNIMIVALKGNLNVPLSGADGKTLSMLKTRYTGNVPHDMPVLTDDFAPVESYLVLRLRQNGN